MLKLKGKSIISLLVIWLCLIIVLLGSFRLHNQRALSFHFVDEEDHIVTADFMNQGLSLYKDLSVNHQPLIYLGSQVLQKITKPNSIYLLIKSHRMAMFVYGSIWSIILVWKFGLIGLIFSLFFEGLKFYSFGNLWLMESMAVYPAVYLFGGLIEGFLNNKWPEKFESIFMGLCSFLVMFNLVPLWPWLTVIWLVYLFKNRKMFLWQLLGLFIPTVILFILISPIDWFRETIFYNVKYAMPKLSVINTFQDWLKIIFFPFLALITKESYQAKIIICLFVGLVISSLVKKKYWLLMLVYGLLILGNLRAPSPEEVFYGGFHLLPWIGMLLIGFLLIFKRVKNKWIILGFSCWGVVLFFNQNMPYFWKTDLISECYINYSRFDDLSFVIKTLTMPGDRMAVLTSESLIYWNTGVKPATRQVVYYSWEHDVPKLKSEYNEVFKGNNPPDFIYGFDESGLTNKEYLNVYQYSKPTELFIRKDKVNDQLKFDRGFEIKVNEDLNNEI
ncbi:MAG: hypothetical protein ABIJ43_04090 [Candidatus Beckwithbacteria bacterium]|nr:hypothetical protein [Patescibacteria group bacterium]